MIALDAYAVGGLLRGELHRPGQRHDTDRKEPRSPAEESEGAHESWSGYPQVSSELRRFWAAFSAMKSAAAWSVGNRCSTYS